MSTDSVFSPTKIPDDVPTELQSKRGLLEPFEWYHNQLQTHPVQFDPDRGVWDTFQYDDVKRIFHSPETFQRPNLSPRTDSGDDDPLKYLGNAMVWSDGSGHDTSKQNMFGHFTPGTLEEMKSKIEQIAKAELENHFTSGEPFDFVSEYAIPVTLKIPMRLLGVPESDYNQILKWIETFAEVSLSEHSDRESTNPKAMAETVEYFEALMAERARNPQDDLISLLVNRTPVDRRFIGANCFDILFAGQGTMTDFLSNAIYLHGQQRIFDQDPDSDMGTVLEEVLRYRSPIQAQARRTTETATVNGIDIPAGERVICWIGAANRDPNKYDNPDEFRPARNPEHLAFGHGSHSCIGFSLARIEAPLILKTFFDAVEEIEVLEDQIIPAPTPQLLTYDQLPVRTTTDSR